MTNPTRRILGFAAFFTLGAATGVGIDRLWRARADAEHPNGKPAASEGTPAGDDEEPEPAAVVRTVVAVQGELHRAVEALGAAAVPATAAFVESWPTDVVVTRVFVQPGEVVAKDAPLVQVTPTRDAETQVASARLAVEATTKALEVAQQKLDRGLTTRTEVIAAQAAHDEAQQRFDRLQKSVPPQDGIVRAHAPGLVGTVHAQAGSTVPAGTPIVDITSESVVAQVGIDPAETAGIALGQVFEVRPIDDHAPDRWTGTLTILARSVNPTTRLVDATLTLSGGPHPRTGMPLRATAVLAGATGVLIPRAALMPEGDGMIVFVVRDGTAVRTPVTVAQRGDDQVVLASGCSAGDRVVVTGQSQLTPGATVREIAAEPKPAQPNGGPGADR